MSVAKILHRSAKLLPVYTAIALVSAGVFLIGFELELLGRFVLQLDSTFIVVAVVNFSVGVLLGTVWSTRLLILYATLALLHWLLVRLMRMGLPGIYWHVQETSGGVFETIRERVHENARITTKMNLEKRNEKNDSKRKEKSHR
jgi:hypothetical protein